MDNPGFAVQHQSTVKPTPADTFGVLAQLVERLNGIEEVSGSIPLGSSFLILRYLQKRKCLGKNTHENASAEVR